ncbi:MAG: flavodoxin [Oscillospiraceae bacterium]
MKKIAIVYWSGTGNTENMANTILDSVKSFGNEANLYNVSDFSANLIDDFDAIAFGCPAMGSEELEDTEFLPVFTECESKLNGKKVALFGSYGWGSGEWLENWKDMCISDGAIVTSTVMCCGEPSSETDEELNQLANSLLAE